MQIGFPTNPRKNIVEEIEWIGKNNFDFVDLFLEEDKAVPSRIRIEEIKSVIEKYGLGTIGHTAWYLPLGSPISSIREAAVKETIKYFKVFSNLGVKYVTIHANWPGGLFSAEEGIKFQTESLKKLVREAEFYGLELMYEPIDSPYDTVENVSAILKRVPELFLHLDIGHANLFGRKPQEFIERLHEKLRHVHLHDNARNKDLHLPPGCGNIKWEETLRTLKKYYDGTITLEVFSQDKDYVLLAKNKLRRLWDSIM